MVLKERRVCFSWPKGTWVSGEPSSLAGRAVNQPSVQICRSLPLLNPELAQIWHRKRRFWETLYLVTH